MTIKISGHIPTKQMLNEVETFLKSKKPMSNITKDIKKGILQRTAAGKDYKYMRFKKYSAKYARQKGQTFVDLKLSGNMLGAMKAEALSSTHGRISITPRSYPGTPARTDMIAQIHTTGTGKQPKREFMNVTKTGLQKIVKKHYDDEILKILRRA